MHTESKIKKISATTNQLWPLEAMDIIKTKKLSVPQLKSAYDEIYFPSSEKYNTERTYFSLLIQLRPLFIIKVKNTKEIESILNYANKNKLTIRICNGRHSTQLLSPEILVDVSNIKQISSCKHKINVGGGATQGQVNEYIFTEKGHNYLSHFGHYNSTRSHVFAGGSAASVGVSGISTIGGIGVLARTFGLTIDHIRSFEITVPPTSTYSAKTITATHDNNADLFWALCGGSGNNFGIISKITYNIIEVNDIIEYNINWNIESETETEKIINQWKSSAPKRSNEFNETLSIYYFDKKIGLSISGYYVIPKNQSEHDAIKMIKKTLKYLKGTLVIENPITYNNLYNKLVKKRTYHNFSILQAIFADNHTIKSKTIVDSIMNSSQITTNNNSNYVIEFELLGGKVASNTTGSFGYRNSDFFIVCSCYWDDLIDSQANKQWLNDLMLKIVNKKVGAYVGFPITFTNIKFSNDIYYGNNYDKLKHVKKIYDPLNTLTYSGTL